LNEKNWRLPADLALKRSTEKKTTALPGADIERLAEHLFRQESGKLVSVLTAVFGPARLQLSEDVAQEALVRALQTWPYYGMPDNPAAWLTQTAKNLALDAIRREAVFHRKEPEISMYLEQRFGGAAAARWPMLAGDIADDNLRLMFTCCHPEIPQEGQAALALKTLCGFDAKEIARAFLTSEAAILKRLTRVRQRIRDMQIPFEIPSGEGLESRLDGVLQTLYLLFNEGYTASSGAKLVRRNLCREAIRLTKLLAEHPAAGLPRVHALLALMLFNAARLSSRTDADGHLLRLGEQDRSTWDGEMITRGFLHLQKSAGGAEVTQYHVEAAIAGCHCSAADYGSTDWQQILWWYDRLLMLDRSPVFALNRAVAVAEVHGAQAGLEAVQAIGDQERLGRYYLYYAMLGEMQEKLGQESAARENFARAAELTSSSTEREYLVGRARLNRLP
jgi:RNA polymerase sigma-70 factor (ECF subfamily)